MRIGLAIFLALALGAASQDSSDKVDKIFNGIEESKGKNLWSAARQLEDLGRGALEDVRSGLRRADPYVRIAAAKVLYDNELKDESLDVLLKLTSESRDRPARLVAAELIGSLLKADASIDAKKKGQIADRVAASAREATEDAVKVRLWRSVYQAKETLEAKRKLLEIWGATTSPEVKDDCALALADMGAYLVSGLTDHLRSMAREPSPNGALARAYLQLGRLNDQVQRGLETSKWDFKLLTEILNLLEENYRDPARVQKEYNKMIENAAKAATTTLDPYTTYLDAEEYKKLTEEDLKGEYGGIGARVSMRKDRNGISWLTIEEPIFSGPAYRKGLRSNDKIVEVEGASTANQDLQDLVRKLRGKPRTDVKIKVWSVRWEKPKDFTITRETVHLETVQHTMLPGSIGYIKLVTFGPTENRKVRDAIRDLSKDGAKALILDLRGNSGGYLETSVAIANLFLEEGKLVVSIQAQNPKIEKQDHVTRVHRETNLPMVTLVDGGSASASEILAGALRDQKRSRLVGEKTFGKGSVQRTYRLDSTEQKSALKITIARWYLPSGESVEKDEHKNSGIEPNVKVPLPDPDVFKQREFERLRANPAIQAYVKKEFTANRELFYKLAEGDGADASQYPEFDALYKSLGTKASADELRELVREYVRKNVQDDRAKEFPCDYQTDVQLGRAILEVAQDAKIDVRALPEYKILAKVDRDY